MISESIRLYISSDEHFEYGYPHFIALMRFLTIKIFVSSQIRALQAAIGM